MKTPPDLDTFLDHTFFGLDTLSMLGDIEDFIVFSEENIEKQKRLELIRATRECDDAQFEDPYFAAQYRDQTIDGICYRFDVSLTQRVRYAALTSIITTIEWVLISLRNRAAFAIPEKPKDTNYAVHLLEVFNQKSSLDNTPQIQLIETLVQIRNCIVHAAGLLKSYKHGADLRKRLSTFSGIKISNINFLDDGIEIERNYLLGVVEDTKRWLPNLEKVMHEKGLLKNFAHNFSIVRTHSGDTAIATKEPPCA